MTLLALVDLWLHMYCADIVPFGRYDVARQTCETDAESVTWQNP